MVSLVNLKDFLTTMDNQNDEEVILNTQEETTDSNEVDTDESSESLEELKERLAKAEELANNYKIRAEKAEKKSERTETPKVAPKKSSDLSPADIIALTKANIDPEDIEEVALPFQSDLNDESAHKIVQLPL